jgi:hydrogenase maturation factor
VTIEEYGPHCSCITCGDQGIAMRVAGVDRASGLARCHETASAAEPALVDIELVAPVAAGDVVLVHAGVALALLERAVVA